MATRMIAPGDYFTPTGTGRGGGIGDMAKGALGFFGNMFRNNPPGGGMGVGSIAPEFTSALDLTGGMGGPRFSPMTGPPGSNIASSVGRPAGPAPSAAPQMGGGGFLGDMNPLEKMFLLSEGAGALGGIYGGIKRAQDEERERERLAEGGRNISAALSRPRAY